MPLRDGTGPMGMGAMTGKQAGYCTAYGSQGSSVQGGRCFGSGFGRGRGSGRGWRHNNRYSARFTPDRGPYSDINTARFAAPTTQEEEKQSLQREAEALQGHLNEVRKRLDELNSKQ